MLRGYCWKSCKRSGFWYNHIPAKIADAPFVEHSLNIQTVWALAHCFCMVSPDCGSIGLPLQNTFYSCTNHFSWCGPALVDAIHLIQHCLQNMIWHLFLFRIDIETHGLLISIYMLQKLVILCTCVPSIDPYHNHCNDFMISWEILSLHYMWSTIKEINYSKCFLIYSLYLTPSYIIFINI